MASKQVIDRQKQAKLVLATGETHASPLTTRLTSELSPHLQRGEKLPDVALLVQLFLRWLGQAETDLVAADLTYERELADDDAPRRARDEAATEVRDQLIELRDLADALYGAQAVRQLGMTGETPTDPMALLRQAKAVLSALGTTKLPPPRRKGAELAPKELEAELRVPAVALDKALTSVSREAREAEVALSDRDRALAEYDRRYSATTAVVASLLAAASESALADRLRPLSGRRRRTADGPSEPESPATPDPTPTPDR